VSTRLYSGAVCGLRAMVVVSVFLFLFVFVGAVDTSAAPGISTTAQQLHAIEDARDRHEAQIVRDDAATRDDRALEARVARLEARKSTPTFWLGLISGAVLALIGQFVKWVYDAFAARRQDGVLIGAARENLQDAKDRVALNQETLADTTIVPLLPLALPGVASLWRAPPKAIRGMMSQTGTLLAAVEHANALSARRDVVAFSGGDENACRLSVLDRIVREQLDGIDKKVDALLGAWPGADA
jgi:hypothetical protein